LHTVARECTPAQRVEEEDEEEEEDEDEGDEVLRTSSHLVEADPSTK
jgi:hypothetical protein